MRHLRLTFALCSLGVAAFFVVWLMFWPAPSRRTKSYTGNVAYYMNHPEAMPTEPYYAFRLNGDTIEFGTIIEFALIWPVTLFGCWVLRRAVAEAAERRAAAARQARRCAGCGYDLRATPQRCPECGREAGAVAADVA